jgi:hypothetical protein
MHEKPTPSPGDAKAQKALRGYVAVLIFNFLLAVISLLVIWVYLGNFALGLYGRFLDLARAGSIDSVGAAHVVGNGSSPESVDLPAEFMLLPQLLRAIHLVSISLAVQLIVQVIFFIIVRRRLRQLAS